jgi:hypothetical protein
MNFSVLISENSLYDGTKKKYIFEVSIAKLFKATFIGMKRAVVEFRIIVHRQVYEMSLHVYIKFHCDERVSANNETCEEK